MSKPFIVALAFTVCALAFLAAMALRQGDAKADCEAALEQWNNSQAVRQQFVDAREAAKGIAQGQPKSVDLPTVMSELAGQLGIDNPEINKQGSARGQARHSVIFPKLTIDTMGQLLGAIRQQHKYLTVRSIDASRSSGNALSEFKWTLEIGSPEN
ncbi:MAG TPA: hypothetical protein PLP01_00590 [Phycisphaerae bacterium]|nr:hypothetical protein [Phycisphaerae bacterium]HOI53727.1 hypothetical protein [Phycisphaerae bacterium]